MKRPAAILAYVLLWLLSHLASGQSNVSDTLQNRFENYQRKNLQEKIYIHLDHTSYVTGETLWFKIYCVDSRAHMLLDVSKVAYVEVVDRQGDPVLKTKIKLMKGEGDGSFFLPATLDSDNYVVRAYTNWMKNTPEEYFFHQPFSIINPFRKKDRTEVSAKPAVDAQFFAEGGTLLAGVEAKIAFRIVDTNGIGMECSGSIINEQNDTVVEFSPSKFGLGSFHFTPGNNTYRAVITDSNQKNYIVPFPKASSIGYSIELINESQNLQFNIRTLGIDQSHVILFGHTRGKTFFVQELPLINGATSFRIPASILNDGVSHFTLFNEELQPVCERLFFKKPKSLLTIRANTDNSEYSPRRKVKLIVDVSNELGIGENASLSVSVHKRDSLETIDGKDIASHLLLSSDLVGEIESPSYYLSNATSQEFDNLMLTHGWRRFAWKEITQPSARSPKYLPELEGPILTGKLYNEIDVPAANTPTFLTNASNAIKVHSFRSGKDGDIRYVLDNIEGATKLYLQTDFTRDSLFRFAIDNPFFNTQKRYNTPALSISANQTNTIISRSVSMQVEDIYSEERKEMQRSLKDTIPFYGTADEIYFLDDYTRFPVMEEVMREYVKGVWVRKRQGKFYFVVLDNINKSVFKQDPLILLDGVPMFDVNKIMAIDPRKIKRIDVLTREYYLGTNTFPGIVSYFTYSGDLAGIKPHAKSAILEYEGLQITREFFSPLYETERHRSNRLPDRRHLLTWIPSSKIVNGKAEIEFFTSDVTGTFKINIQAIAPNGKPGSSTTLFTVSDYND
jgi:hypothetical protein